MDGQVLYTRFQFGSMQPSCLCGGPLLGGGHQLHEVCLQPAILWQLLLALVSRLVPFWVCSTVLPWTWRGGTAAAPRLSFCGKYRPKWWRCPLRLFALHKHPKCGAPRPMSAHCCKPSAYLPQTAPNSHRPSTAAGFRIKSLKCLTAACARLHQVEYVPLFSCSSIYWHPTAVAALCSSALSVRCCSFGLAFVCAVHSCPCTEISRHARLGGCASDWPSTSPAPRQVM